MNELTRRDEVAIAGAALHGAPWRAAALTGGGAALVCGVLGGLLPGPSDWSGAVGFGIALFTLVATLGAVTAPDRGDRTTRQARLWALRNPWRFALYPAAGAAVLMYPVQLVLDGDGVFGAAWDALWGGATVYLITAVLTLLLRGRATC